MEPLALLHQAALFGHTMAFAITVSAVLREDLRLLARRRFDPAQLQRTMRVVGAGLLVLWMTGLVLVLIAATMGPVPWAPSAKLGAKLVVVALYGAAVVTALIVARVLFARPPARAEPAAG